MPTTPRILIVEDQFFVAADSELQLKAAGFECVGLATTAAEAIELAEREQPDLILMDIWLAGGSNGVDAATDIYRRLGVRCIFCSGHADARTRAQARQARPLGWLDKPYSADTLINAVNEGLTQLYLDTAPENRQSDSTSSPLR